MAGTAAKSVMKVYVEEDLTTYITEKKFGSAVSPVILVVPILEEITMCLISPNLLVLGSRTCLEY